MKKETYDVIKEAVKQRSGLNLGDEKHYLVEARIKPLALLAGHESIDTFVDWLRENQKEWTGILSQHMATHETFFFRDPDVFIDLVELIFPTFHSKSTIRVWSAACSTGQEPFSIAMSWLEHKHKFSGQYIKIIATDFAEKPLEKAKNAIYSQYEVQRGLPIQYLVKYFTKVELDWQIKPEVKSMIHFELDNLLSPASYHHGYDVIFVRNVLIYLDLETKKKIIENLYERLNEGGFLILGSAETLFGISEKFQRLKTAKSIVYQKKV